MKLELLKEIRAQKKLSQETVAEAAGITPVYLSQVERGKNPNVSFKIVVDICRALKIPVSIVAGDITRRDWEKCSRVLEMFTEEGSQGAP